MTVSEIESVLNGLQDLPTPVSAWQIETGLDSTDDPAVWVWVILEAEEVDAGTRARLRDMVRERIGRETADWVYVYFRGASEIGLAS